MSRWSFKESAFILFLILALSTVIIASLSVGVGGFVNPLNPADSVEEALLRYRALRVASGLIAGFVLAVSGLTIQRVTRNPLADPFLLGISPGAITGILLSMTMTSQPIFWYLSSFMGGVTSYAIASSISRFAGYTPLSLIVAGVTVSYFVYGLNLLLLTILHAELRGSPLLWLFGSLAYVRREELTLTLIFCLIGLALIMIFRRELDVLILSDDVAKALGVKCELVRVTTVTGATLATAAITATVGPIGFVGIAAPWLARFAKGGSFIELSVTAGLIGALLVVSSDLSIRLLMGGLEPPITAFMTIIGAPILAHLVIKLSG